VYFGDIGQNSRTLLDYFEGKGARTCGAAEHPAEYMLEVVNQGTDPTSRKDWVDIWRESEEASMINRELNRIHHEQTSEETVDSHLADSSSEFAVPFWTQLCTVTYRVFQQYWRMSSYVYAKFGLGVASGPLTGFSFWKSDTSLQGMQNVISSVFMICAIFTPLVQQGDNPLTLCYVAVLTDMW
jgi:ATP-binding cassette subfamily G (WHITE) protein 2 (PDR)